MSYAVNDEQSSAILRPISRTLENKVHKIIAAPVEMYGRESWVQTKKTGKEYKQVE